VPLRAARPFHKLHRCSKDGLMTPYYLPPHVRCCSVRDGAVFLDLRRHKYIGLPLSEARLLLPRLHGQISACSRARDRDSLDDANELARALVDRGLLTTRAQVGGHPAEHISVDLTSVIEPDERCTDPIAVTAGCVFTLTASYIITRLKLQLLTFERLIAYLETAKQRRARPASVSERRLENLVLAFRRARGLIYTAREKCLIDSLVLFDFLRRHGIITTFIIGVSTQPFSAHSWVQCGSIVLNDSLEHAREYTPILVV
jgi:hypothetical protein